MISRLYYLIAQVQVDPGDLGVPTDPLTGSTLQSVLQVVFGVAGAIAFLMVIIGGLKYVLSQGNSQETSKAKNTILYALIGLVISLLAFSIVRFVIGGIQ